MDSGNKQNLSLFFKHYKLGHDLAKGSFGCVKFATHISTKTNLAVKMIEKNVLDKIALEHLYNEINNMKSSQHPNIVFLYDYYETNSKLLLVLELGDEDLLEYIIKYYNKVGMPEEMAVYFFYQIVSAVEFCHQKKVAHRDLKPQNIIVFKAFNAVKLGDFGFSIKVDNVDDTSSTMCGSMPYTAPEIYLKDSYEPMLADSWSLGIVFLIMLSGKIPFFHMNQSEMLTNMIDGNYSPPKSCKHCNDVLKNTLLRAPEKRLSVTNILKEKLFLDHNMIAKYFQDNKIIKISSLLHKFTVKSMVQQNLATKSTIQENFINNNCNMVTASYYLLSRKTFQNSSGPDPINYILQYPKPLLEEKTKSCDSTSEEYVSDDILHKISVSMENVTKIDSDMSSCSLKNPMTRSYAQGVNGDIPKNKFLTTGFRPRKISSNPNVNRMQKSNLKYNLSFSKKNFKSIGLSTIKDEAPYEYKNLLETYSKLNLKVPEIKIDKNYDFNNRSLSIDKYEAMVKIELSKKLTKSKSMTIIVNKNLKLT